MYATNTTKLLYVSYPKETTTVFKVSFDEDLWYNIRGKILRIYGTDKISKQSRLFEMSKT